MREWNADSYHRVSTPQFDWGTAVLDRLPLEGDELVLVQRLNIEARRPAR